MHSIGYYFRILRPPHRGLIRTTPAIVYIQSRSYTMDAASAFARSLNKDLFNAARSIDNGHLMDSYIQDYMEVADGTSSECDSSDDDMDDNASDLELEGDEDEEEENGLDVGIERVLRAVDMVTVDTECETEEMSRIRNFDCKCQVRRKENSKAAPTSCIRNVNPELVYQSRMSMAAKSSAEQDTFIQGILFYATSDTEMTVSTKKLPTKRKLRRTTYRIHNTVVCRDTFCFALG